MDPLPPHKLLPRPVGELYQCIREFHVATIGNDFEASSFSDYITKHPPKGIGASVDLVRRLLADYPDVLAMFERELVGEERTQLDKQTPDLKAPHRPKKRSHEENVATVSGRGSAYALARLRKDRPDIHARVLAGEISPRAGMIEAGFRKKAERKKLTTLEKLASAVAKLTDDEWHELSQKENQRRGRLI